MERSARQRKLEEYKYTPIVEFNLAGEARELRPYCARRSSHIATVVNIDGSRSGGDLSHTHETSLSYWVRWPVSGHILIAWTCSDRDALP